MKTKKHNSGAIKIILIITEIFALQINFLFAANPIDRGVVNHLSTCMPCTNSASATQRDVLLNTLISLAPTTPNEATFTDETTNTEINLAPTTPADATFENDPESESICIPECLIPTTPAEADFNE